MTAYFIENAELIKWCEIAVDVIQIYCRYFLEVSEPISRSLTDGETSNSQHTVSNDEEVEGVISVDDKRPPEDAKKSSDELDVPNKVELSVSLNKYRLEQLGRAAVVFAHRTAHDFIFDSQNGRRFMAKAMVSDEHRSLELIKGLTRKLFLLSTPLPLALDAGNQFDDVIRAIVVLQLSTTVRDTFLDELCSRICSLSEKPAFAQFVSQLKQDSWSSNLMTGLLLDLGTNFQLINYVSSRLDLIAPDVFSETALLAIISSHLPRLRATENTL